MSELDKDAGAFSSSPRHTLVAALGAVYIALHIFSLNFYPIDAWTLRILHVAGAFSLASMLVVGSKQAGQTSETRYSQFAGAVSLAIALCGLVAYLVPLLLGLGEDDNLLYASLIASSAVIAIPASWVAPSNRRWRWSDMSLALLSALTGYYLLDNLTALQFRAGVMPTTADAATAFVALLLVLEMTRRTTGLAMVLVALAFIAYGFVGQWLPGVLHHDGYGAERLLTYLYTDNGVLGPTVAVSSTYLVLFIVFAALIEKSGTGDYFVQFAMGVAGRARGGPAKVAVIASALMGTINGSSAGNVVSTGSLTIPLNIRAGFRPRVAAAIEAAASSGGLILPPIMGAGAFIMAEITGIPYSEIIIAAIIPGLLYFISLYFMVDFEAARTDVRGLASEDLPERKRLLRNSFLFIPVLALILALLSGYSIIRAGSIGGLSAIVISWLGTSKVGPRRLYEALARACRMALPLISICACAGIVVGIIGLTGIGQRFSALLLTVADTSDIAALVMAMLISVLLGMGMPTTAAYAVAASVVAPGLIELGIPTLVAHFFVFFFAVMSAITPPVALAAYAGAAIAGSNPMRTGVESFKLGAAAFLIPFLFAYNPELLMEGNWLSIAIGALSASLGVFMLAASLQQWLLGPVKTLPRLILLAAAVLAINPGWLSDLVALAIGLTVLAWQWRSAN